MVDDISERRLVENEAIFREANEQVLKDIEELKTIAKSEGYDASGYEQTVPLYFYCECSNQNCRERIQMTPNEYKDQHQNSSQFILIPGHEIPEIERVVTREEKFVVAEKFMSVPPDLRKENL